jgi:two-component system, chemotaxis family, response regulator Rcp1
MTPIQVLLVEDNEADADLMCEILQASRIHLELATVADGTEAIDFLRKKGSYAGAVRPDLILLDLNLPRKDGREVLQEIKEDPSLRLIPVVVMTSSAAEADVVRSYGLGANCYVTKPVDWRAFQEIVKAIEGFWFTIVRLPPAEDSASDGQHDGTHRGLGAMNRKP